jgi:hypothetical protein
MILETILALSAVDYDHLARAVSVEAAKNTFDEYCVAVSILNRVNSQYFPNTVADVVYSPGQYQGFHKECSHYSRIRPYSTPWWWFRDIPRGLAVRGGSVIVKE